MKLQKIIQEASDYLKNQLPDRSKYPKGRNSYTLVSLSAKNKFQRSYKEIENEKFNEILVY